VKRVFIPEGVILPWSNIRIVDPFTKRTVNTLTCPPPGQVGYVPVYESEETLREQLGDEVSYTVQGIAEEGDAPPGFPDF
jgi:hypothetical protein